MENDTVAWVESEKWLIDENSDTYLTWLENKENQSDQLFELERDS